MLIIGEKDTYKYIRYTLAHSHLTSEEELNWYTKIYEQFASRPSTIARTADEIKGGIE
jgi:hypothetical protein